MGDKPGARLYPEGIKLFLGKTSGLIHLRSDKRNGPMLGLRELGPFFDWKAEYANQSEQH
jgi:hypothetical protein